MLLKAKFGRKAKAHFDARKIPDEAYYEMAAAEISDGKIRHGLWVQALAEAEGDQRKAEALYIKLRVRAMRVEVGEAVYTSRTNNKKARKNHDVSNDETHPPVKIVLSCPACNGRMRVPAGKHLEIKCSHCGEIFEKLT